MKNNLDISICLVNHNARELTLDCLDSIYQKTKRAFFEVILVDNNSTDGSVLAIQSRYPKVNLMINQSNPGFAVANNQAIKKASGKYILLLNNDTSLKNEALDIMLNFMRQDPGIGILTCKLFEADGKTIQRNCRSFPGPLDTLFGRASLLTRIFPKNPISKKNLLADWDYNSIKDVDWVSGAAMMIKKEVIDEIGLLDGAFFMYWEDTDFCKRARNAGWRIGFIPEAKIFHYTGKGGGKRSLSSRLYTMYQMHRSAYYYFRKHYYSSFLHPMAILTFAGMVTLVAFKGIHAIFKYVFGNIPKWGIIYLT